MKFYTLDKNKKPVVCGMVEWSKSFGIDRHVKLTKLNNWQTQISTVFLGVDHRFIGAGKPILWETMIFCENKAIDSYMLRATSKKQALKNHYKVVSALRNNHLNTL